MIHTVAKLQVWSSKKNNLIVGGHRLRRVRTTALGLLYRLNGWSFTLPGALIPNCPTTPRCQNLLLEPPFQGSPRPHNGKGHTAALTHHPSFLAQHWPGTSTQHMLSEHRTNTVSRQPWSSWAEDLQTFEHQRRKVSLEWDIIHTRRFQACIAIIEKNRLTLVLCSTVVAILISLWY